MPARGVRQCLTEFTWWLRHPRWARERAQVVDPAPAPLPRPQSDPASPLYRAFLDQQAGLKMHKWHHDFDIHERDQLLRQRGGVRVPGPPGTVARSTLAPPPDPVIEFAPV